VPQRTLGGGVKALAAGETAKSTRKKSGTDKLCVGSGKGGRPALSFEETYQVEEGGSEKRQGREKEA